MLNNIKNLFIKPKLDKEALEAYWHKLPEKIEIQWIRDGKFIIGRIEADGNEFITQAISAAEFVEMVNDTVFAAYEIPIKYFEVLESRRFKPTKEDFEKLNDAAINKSQMAFEKETVMV